MLSLFLDNHYCVPYLSVHVLIWLLKSQLTSYSENISVSLHQDVFFLFFFHKLPRYKIQMILKSSICRLKAFSSKLMNFERCTLVGLCYLHERVPHLYWNENNWVAHLFRHSVDDILSVPISDENTQNRRGPSHIWDEKDILTRIRHKLSFPSPNRRVLKC